MNLSRNFTLSELIKSDTAIRKGINNNPNAEQIEKLKDLCENILQPVRDHFGRVKVTSGFRSVDLCLAIGSSANSQHAKAEAADFECGSTVAGYLKADVHSLCMLINLRVKQNTNQ
jgi:zinc D-Ala-D-Ala carboxypeptidase